MTVVCYDGELLAADRMSRVSKPNGTRQIKSLSKEKISTNFNGVQFDGEPILAVGRSGRVRVSKTLIRLLRRNVDLTLRMDSIKKTLRRKFTPEEMNDAKPSLKRITGALKNAVPENELSDLSSSLEKVTDAIYGRLSSDEEKPTASLIIVTSGHVHLLRVFSDYRVDWQKEEPTKKLAIGSGKVVALFLMEHLGINAIDAVASMELHHEGCGGGVTYTSRALSRLEVSIMSVPHYDRNQLAGRLLEVGARSTSSRLSLFSNLQ